MIRNLLMGAAAAALLAACSADGQTANQASAEKSERGEAETRRFVNSRDRAGTPALREGYIDFALDYPASWSVVPQGEGSRNFVDIAGPNNASSIMVSTARFSDLGPNGEGIEDALPDLAEQLGRDMPDYRATGLGRQRIGRYDTWGWRFSATAPSPNGGTRRVSGRADLYLPEGRSTALFIATMAAEDAPEYAPPSALGETGATARMYDSLRIGEDLR